MCRECWNADTFKEKVEKYGKGFCDGSVMLTMTLEELKKRLTKASTRENKTSFKIFDKAVVDLPKGTEQLQFKPKNCAKSINVQFV